jgi:NADH dehydrogenase [ubiquinone] 1 alpha subcomplex assembly factor 5
MNSVDAVISCLGLHWVNDLPGAMSSAAATLVPDGLFLSSIFGGNTLQELPVACALAETEHEGGVSARVSPLAHVRDCGSLLGRANLSLLAVDLDIVTMGYGSPEKLVETLRATG